MTNKVVKNLVLQSYDDGRLLPEIVEYIADRLKRKDLKRYIRFLKEEERKNYIFVTSPKALTTVEREKIQKLFPKKQLIQTVDQSMPIGIKIVENDKEFEINLNQTFHDIMIFLNKK